MASISNSLVFSQFVGIILVLPMSFELQNGRRNVSFVIWVEITYL